MSEDRLSNLPEEVLSHILSLMATRFAVRTSTLAKTWRYNWTLVTNLDINDYHRVYGLDCCSDFIDRVLKLCKASQVTLFRLCFSPHGMRTTRGSKSWSYVSKSNVTKWINEAVRLNVCELDVNVPRFELPLSMFTCKTLTKLSLVGWNNVLEDINVPSLVKLPRLKTLDISIPGNACEGAFKLIGGCPMLESLSFEMVYPRGGNKEYYNFNIPTLKRLILITVSTKEVVLNVPNLEYLCVDGVSCSRFVIKDLSSLVEASLRFSCIERLTHLTHLYAELLKGINGAKLISFHSPSDLNFVLKLHVPEFPNLKHLVLKRYFSSRWMQVFQQFESSSKLEHLCFQEPEGPFWSEPSSAPTWMLTNLKTMKITKCKGRNCDLRFIEYMLANAHILKTLTISCNSMLIRDEMRFCARLLTFPRASTSCQIHLAGKWLKSMDY